MGPPLTGGRGRRVDSQRASPRWEARGNSEFLSPARRKGCFQVQAPPPATLLSQLQAELRRGQSSFRGGYGADVHFSLSLWVSARGEGEKPGGAEQEGSPARPTGSSSPGTEAARDRAQPAPGVPRIPPQPGRLVTPGVHLPKGKRGGAWHVLCVPNPEASRLSFRDEAPSLGQNLTRAPILVQCELALVAESGGTDRLRERQKRAPWAGVNAHLRPHPHRLLPSP